MLKCNNITVLLYNLNNDILRVPSNLENSGIKLHIESWVKLKQETLVANNFKGTRILNGVLYLCLI